MANTIAAVLLLIICVLVAECGVWASLQLLECIILLIHKIKEELKNG